MGTMRKLFGPSQAEVWAQLSLELGGQSEHGFWKGSKVRAVVEEWTVILDTYTVSTGQSTITYTRMRAPYVNPSRFHFAIYPEGFFAKIGKVFGMQDVVVGFPEFDDRYIIKGNDDSFLRQLFASSELRHRITAQPDIHLEIRQDDGWFGTTFPEGVDMLTFQVVGVLKDIPRLKALFELFGCTLDQLCNIGAAYETDPGFSL